MEGKKIILYAAVILIALAVVFLPGFSKLQKLRRENDVLQKRIGLLEEHNDALKEEIAKMQQDPGYVEKKAREKLGIIKKGEIIYKPSSERSGE
jgi:cell division protein FtsB